MKKKDTLGAIPPNQKSILNRAGNYSKRKANARTFGQDLMRGEHVVGDTSGSSRAKDLVGGFKPPASERLLLPPACDTDFYRAKTDKEKQLGRKLTNAEFYPLYVPPTAEQVNHGTSIFDPVLCELTYRWFMPAGGAVLDPFAGGSVRGIVASVLGHNYTGVDLSERQVKANRQQAAAICRANKPEWICGDSLNLDALLPKAAAFDLVFTCPPYFDLEVYSDDPRDLSRADWPTFRKCYREIIRLAVGRLKPDRFACFIVGDVRDENGFYRNLPGETIAAFQDAGAVLYNEAVLVTAVGSLPVRIGRQFEGGRKLGKTHQNCLVFLKGSAKDIRAWPVPEFGYPAMDGDLSRLLASPGSVDPQGTQPAPQLPKDAPSERPATSGKRGPKSEP